MLTYFRYQGGRIEHHSEFRLELFLEAPKALHWLDLDDPSPDEVRVLEEPFDGTGNQGSLAVQ